MKSRRNVWLGALLTVMAVASAMALTVTHAAAGLSFDIPDGWEAAEEPDEDGILSVTAPDNVIVLQVWAQEAEGLDAAIDALLEELQNQFDEVGFDEEVKEVEINGLQAVALTGDAVQDGNPLKLLVAIVAADQPVVFLGLAQPDAVEEYNDTVRDMFASIRPAE